MYFKNVIFVAKMCKYGIFVAKIGKYGIFVAKIGKYGIFVAKIYKYALIDSFQGSAGSLDSAASCAALVVQYFMMFQDLPYSISVCSEFTSKLSPVPSPEMRQPCKSSALVSIVVGHPIPKY